MFRTSDPYVRGHSGFLNTMFTVRRGRTRYISSWERNIENQCAKIFLTIFFVLFIFGAPLALVSSEMRLKTMKTTFDEVASKTTTINPYFQVNPELNGRLVHFHVPDTNIGNVIVPDRVAKDVDFGLEFDGALEVKRVVEYCQWMEHHKDKEYTDRNGNKHVERTYYYTKGWTNRPIMSLAFDQPAAHHNPLRDPFPATSFLIHGARVANGNYHLSPEVISNHKIPFRTVREYSKDTLQRAGTTAANSEPHGFKYIGDGYFFSPYQQGTVTKVLRLFGQVLEGSILDYQVSDFLAQCEAGDIRVRYQQAKPAPGKGISVIGAQLKETGEVGTLEASTGYHVGFIHEGSYKSAEAMYDQEVSYYRWGTLLFMRILIIIWGLVVSLRIMGDFASSFSSLMVSTVMFATLFEGLVWTVLYGPFTISPWACFLCSSAALVFLTSNASSVQSRPSSTK